MALLRRGVGAASRRLGRPELLAAVDAEARREEHDTIAIRAALASTLRRDSTYVDIGANRGQVLAEALRIAPAGRHIAFEPIPSLAAELASSAPEVDVRALALGAQPERTRFCHFRSLDGWSGLRRSPRISDAQGDPEYIEVEVSTLDAQLEGASPVVIKLDVEGGELAVVQGGRALLARARPLLIFEHVAEAAALYGASSEELWDLLGQLGYRIFTVTGDGPVTRARFSDSSATVNWLAAPSDSTAAAGG